MAVEEVCECRVRSGDMQQAVCAGAGCVGVECVARAEPAGREQGARSAAALTTLANAHDYTNCVE